MFSYLQYQIIDMLQRRKDSGNLFVKQEVVSSFDASRDAMAITPFTGKPLEPETLAISEIPVLHAADETPVENDSLPGRENSLHLFLHRCCPVIQSIVHVQSEAVAAFSQLGESLPVFSPIHAENFPGTIHCIEAEYDKGDCAALKELMDGLPIKENGAVFLKGDGALVWAETSEEAAEKSAVLEKICSETISSSGYREVLSPELCTKLYCEEKEKRQYNKTLHPVSGKLVSEEENRLICINLLRYLDSVCRENGIHYSVIGGTLLGAVRHRGFIPWDDDIDTILTRPEYEKLIAVFPEEGPYRLYNRKAEKNYAYVWSRLIDTRTIITESPNSASSGKGLFLDICVADGLPKREFFRKLHILHLELLFRLRRCCIQSPETNSKYYARGVLVAVVKKVVKKITDMNYWNKRMDKAMRRYSFDRSDYVGNFVSSGYGKKEMLHKNVFDSYSDIQFEGITTMVCDGYEEYLTNIYGDYMTLPPFEERHGHHVSKAYWL